MPIKYDGEIDISTGKSRKETSWKNVKVKWSRLLTKFSKPHRTHETFSEYLSFEPDRQAEIKDVGGFVGGVVVGGRRKKDSVLLRQLLTLDLDQAKPGFWEAWSPGFKGAVCVYSTHKHSPENPRLRLIIPLLREVHTDEYQAISRKIAGLAGIDQFDPTTFEPERLMYWPSCPVDGQYVFHYKDGPWLDPDGVLSLYRDWHDSSQWPVNSNVTARITSAIKKQGDPLAKDGIIGAFCRTYYPINEAIETYLADVYTPSIEGRYTYKMGTASNGLVIYEDKFCFSHHGTDPASGKLCNAWDIVRIHLFGSLDDDQGDFKKSQAAMQDLAREDKLVKRQLGIERMKSIEEDFGITFSDTVKIEPGTDLKWAERLNTDRRGNPFPTIENILIILNHDPGLVGCLGLNLFAKRYTILKNLPWRDLKEHQENWSDRDDASIRLYLESHYRISHKANLLDALEICFSQHAYHPVRDYLRDIKWDRIKRAEYILVDYLGAQNTDYVRTVTIKTLLGAVARIYKPGIKFDNALVLIGPQGCGKSTLVNKLGVKWHSDSFGSLQNNKAYEQIQGVWLMEMGELAGIKKAEVEEIKLFISKQVDSFRPAYGRRVEIFPRESIFIGTTNEETPLLDQTGGRRFWPVDVMWSKPDLSVFDDLTPETVAQIWAEVRDMFSRGMSLHLDSEMEKVAGEVQKAHTEEYHFAGLVKSYLDKLVPDNWQLMSLSERKAFMDPEADPDMLPVGLHIKNEVCAMEIFCEVIGGNRKDFSRYTSRDINYFMKGLSGWEYQNTPKRFGIYGLQKYYSRVNRDRLV